MVENAFKNAIHLNTPTYLTEGFFVNEKVVTAILNSEHASCIREELLKEALINASKIRLDGALVSWEVVTAIIDKYPALLKDSDLANTIFKNAIHLKFPQYLIEGFFVNADVVTAILNSKHASCIDAKLIKEALTNASKIRLDGGFVSWKVVETIINQYGDCIDKEIIKQALINASKIRLDGDLVSWEVVETIINKHPYLLKDHNLANAIFKNATHLQIPKLLKEGFCVNEKVVTAIVNSEHASCIRKKLIKAALINASQIDQNGKFVSWKVVETIINKYGDCIDKEIIKQALINASKIRLDGDLVSWKVVETIINKHPDLLKDHNLANAIFKNAIHLEFPQYLKEGLFVSKEVVAAILNSEHASCIREELLKEALINASQIRLDGGFVSWSVVETIIKKYGNCIDKEIIKQALINASKIRPDGELVSWKVVKTIINKYGDLPQDLICKVFEKATHLRITRQELQNVFGNNDYVQGGIVKAILDNQTYVSYINLDHTLIAEALKNASKLRKDGKTPVNDLAVKMILGTFPLEKLNFFVLQALWAHPDTSYYLINLIFDYCKKQKIFDTLPPRNLSSKATANEIHVAMMQYMGAIRSYVESQISEIKCDADDCQIAEEFTEKIRKSPYAAAFNTCTQAIKANNLANPGMYTPINFSQDLVKIAKLFKLLTKNMSEEKVEEKEEKVEEKADELLYSYLQVSFGEAATAYDGPNGVSCVRGIIERIYSGLKVVDEKIKDILKEFEGTRFLQERLKTPKAILNNFKIEKFSSFEDMMQGVVQHMCDEASKEFLDLKKTLLS